MVGAIATMLAAAASDVAASSNQANGANGLTGTWVIRVTLRNCATNAPTGSAAALVTFHRGGTISESTGSPAFAIGQRGPAHGTWTHLGRRRYAQRMIAQIAFDTPANLPGPGFDPTKPVSPGFSAGWQTVTHTIRMIDDNNLESSGTNEFFDTLSQSYRTGCSTAVGSRFE
jgi:hypothetical protein